jgi:hypothetical protein
MIWPIINLPDSQCGAPLDISVLGGSARFEATPRGIKIIQLWTHLATVTNLSNTVLGVPYCVARVWGSSVVKCLCM